ncbi:ABC transporter substrate-binding protein [Corynebacterium propinquum]|uniref:ABC transporter substrate-binding protein n=1 Tax=Corynebacterium propinquum TaxID=43769 RepID=UPI00254C912D|nr:ABC transporter substrate-binding protein [Corynebacterium propinquum]MDK8535873.1 ABC transporter substrate-binding protein [Corynebacterium propinquum]
MRFLRIRQACAALAGVGMLAALTACATEESEPESNSADAASEERVVVLNTGQLENALQLGVVPVGVAVAKNAEAIPEFVHEEYGDEVDLDGIEVVGERANPDIEAIAALKPTHIFANERTDSEIVKKLEQLAPVTLGKGGGENWKGDFKILADALDKTEEYDKFMKNYEKRADALDAAIDDGVGTISLLRPKNDSFNIFGVESMAGIVAADAGLQRPDSQQFTDKSSHDISAEELGLADADWIFYGVVPGSPNPTETSLWGSLGAVHKDHAVEVDNDGWYLNASWLSATLIQDGLAEHLADGTQLPERAS